MGDNPITPINFSSGDQLGRVRTQEILGGNEFELQSLPLNSSQDYLDRTYVNTSSVHMSRGDRVALHARTHWFHDGIEYRLLIKTGAFRCDRTDACVGRAREEADNMDHSNRIVPGNSFPTAFYLGDLNGDRRPDLLAVLANGTSIVFYQQP